MCEGIWLIRFYYKVPILFLCYFYDVFGTSFMGKADGTLLLYYVWRSDLILLWMRFPLNEGSRDLQGSRECPFSGFLSRVLLRELDLPIQNGLCTLIFSSYKFFVSTGWNFLKSSFNCIFGEIVCKLCSIVEIDFTMSGDGLILFSINLTDPYISGDLWGNEAPSSLYCILASSSGYLILACDLDWCIS